MKRNIFLLIFLGFLSGCTMTTYTKRVLVHDNDGAVVKAEYYRCLYPSYEGSAYAQDWQSGVNNENYVRMERTILYPFVSVLTLGIQPAADLFSYLFTNPTKSDRCGYLKDDDAFFAPVLNAMSASNAVSGTSIEIRGRNLDRNPKVFFNDVKAEITNVSENSLSVIVPNAKFNNADVYIQTSVGRTKNKPFAIIPARSPMLSIENLDFAGENGGKILMADSKGAITFRISNARRAGKAFNIKVVPVLENKKKIEGLEIPETVEIGDIPAGTSKIASIPLKTGLNLKAGKLSFALKFSEANGFDPEPLHISFDTAAIEKPDIMLAELSIDDTLYPSEKKLSVGNGNNIVDLGETIEAEIELFNAGEGTTKNTVIALVSDSKEIDFKTDTVFKLGNIPSGSRKKITAAFSISKRYKGGDILPIKLAVTDSRRIFNKQIPLGINVNRSYPKIDGVNVQNNYVRPEKPGFELGNDLASIPVAKKSRPDAVAVVMGVRQYSDIDVPLVNYALNDAQTVKDYLEKALGYDPKNIIYMANPTHGDMMRVFGKEGDPRGQLSSYIVKGKSEVFVYYSGHGAPDINTRKAYLVPADASPSFIAMNGYSLDTLYKNLALLPAKKITVVTDACFSGAFNSGTLLKNASPLAITPSSAGYERLNIFSSSKGTEISSWYTEKKHGLYTYFFLKGLQGDADKDGNKVITAEELENYLEEKVPALALRLYNRRQNPGFSGRKNEKIAEYRQGKK